MTTNAKSDSLSKYKELMAQAELLQKEAQQILEVERKQAIDSIVKMMTEFNISIDDLTTTQPRARKAKNTGVKVEPKYKNADGSKTWTGRGKRPGWVNDVVNNGGKLEDLLIEKASAQ